MNWKDEIDKRHKGQSGFFKEIEQPKRKRKNDIMKVRFFKREINAQKYFNKLPIPSGVDGDYFLVKYTDGMYKGKFCVTDEITLKWNGGKYEELDIKA